MRHLGYISVLVLILISSPNLYGSETYEIDPAHSSVTFMANHFAVGKIHGSFRDFSGTIELEIEDVPKSSFRGKIQVASIATRNSKRDADLRSSRFLDSDQFSEITFQSTKLEINDYSYVMTGNLTLHGITKEISIPFGIVGPIVDPKKELRIGVEGVLALNRQDFGLTYNEKLDNGGLIIGNEIRIHINGEAIRKNK